MMTSFKTDSNDRVEEERTRIDLSVSVTRRRASMVGCGQWVEW